MALPKEPRQKMINMMYLVLTALLALNVSNEVLEAFKTVDRSIETSNKSLAAKNDVIYKAFEADLKDEQTKAKAAIWAPKADQVKKLSADIDNYLSDMKQQLKKESGLHTEGGKEEFKEDDLDAATRLFAEKGEGKNMYNKLKEYKAKVLAVLNPDEFKDNPDLAKAIAAKKAEFERTLPLDLRTPEKANAEKSGDDAKDWTFNYFHMTPTIASLTILSKFQNDVKNSESQLVDYIHSQVGQVKVVYNKFAAIAQANRTYAMPGDDIEITAGIGAFSDAAQPNITINGQHMSLTDGKALFKTTASGAGEHSIAVKIEYTTPDGKKEVKDEVVKYTVGTPSGASLFLEKMNVVYQDVENPVTISAGSAGAEKMNVSFTNGSISKISGDRYNIVPTTLGLGKVNITVNGKTTPFEVRVKQLPNPVVMVGGKTSGAIPAAAFKSQGGMIATLKDSEFNFPYEILGYKIGARNPNGIYQEIAIDGPRWTAAAALISAQAPGSVVYFDNIQVKGPGGKKRSIDGTYFSLK
ncbi:MAG: gliding motility protein GldM [Bacteroidota bacterium]|nr:gliding motility protein GldM [Bacteroidota bacterium]